MKKYLTFVKCGISITAGFIDYSRRIYVTHRDRTHMFRKFGNGFGISVIILNYLRSEGIENIAFVFEGRLLYTKVQEFYDWGEKYHNEKDNQLILPISYFLKGKESEDNQAKIDGWYNT